MLKQAVVVYYKGKPIKTLSIKTFTSSADFIAFSKECAENEKTLLKELEAKKVELENLKKEFLEFKTNVNLKLKDYHDILQVLTKEN